MTTLNRALKELFENEFYAGVLKLKSAPEEIRENYSQKLLNSIDKALEIRERILEVAKQEKMTNKTIQSLDQFSEWKVATINLTTLDYDLKFLWTPDAIAEMSYDEATNTVLRGYIIQYWFRTPEEISIYIPVPALKGDYAPWMFNGEYLFENVYFFLREVFKFNLREKKPNAWKGFVATIRLMYHQKVAPQEVVEYAFDNFEEVREMFSEMKKKYAQVLSQREPLMPILTLESYYEAPRRIAEKFGVNPETFDKRVEIAENYAKDYIKTIIDEIGKEIPI